MTPTISLRKALADDNLLGTAIAGDSWKPWRVLLTAAMGEALTDEERVLFTQLTGREREPLQCVHQFVAVVGRRGGKSRAMAVLAAFISGLCKHDALVAGEKGVLLCVALDQRVAGIILNYCEAIFANSAVLKQLISNRTQDALELSNGISIEVRPASFRKLRGPTFIGVIADELAYWFTDGYSYANPDIEILNAIEPGLATTHGPLILASSPHARKGVLWDVFKRHYGAEGDPLTLVAHGASRIFNTTLLERVVARAIEKDEPRGRAEYMAEFRSDVETFVPRENVESCVDVGVRERGRISRYRYSAFADPSGGSSDSFTLAVGHRQDGVAVIDVIREVRPPFSPEQVVSDFCVLLERYGVKRIEGDRYGGEWPAEQFKKRAVVYTAAAKPKSEIYRDFLPLLNSKQVSLLDHPRLINQIIGLERRVGRGSGKEVIDHGPHGHDDVCNVVAGVCVKLLGSGSHGYDSSLRWVYDDPEPVPAVSAADDAKSLTELLANLPAPPIRNGPDFFGRG